MTSIRAPFSRQPARVLLVDFSPPFNKAMCINVSRALEQLFSIVCHLSGPCRIPYFGLFALGSYSENLFPLQHVRGNLPRLRNALEELRSFQRDGGTVGDGNKCMMQAMQEAILQFKRQSQTLRQTTGFSAQLELILITCLPASSVAKDLESITRDLDVETLRKIQVVSLSSPELIGDFFMDHPPSQVSSTTSSDGLLGNSGAVETITIETDLLSLQNFLYGWLHDQSTDREHLHLKFPKKGYTEGFHLKCDLQERVINPAMLTAFQDNFTLNMHCSSSKKPITPANSALKSPGMPSTMPVVHLQVIKLVKIGGICESVVFGVPLIVHSTACWKLDWEELESNQQNFQALCQLLHEKDLALLVREESSHSQLSSYPATSFSAASQKSAPYAHYLLLPSHGGTLLLKSVANCDLMLPSNGHAKAETPVSDALVHVESHLHKLDVLDVFNPLTVNSGLNESLIGLISKSGPKRNLKRPSRGGANVPPAMPMKSLVRGQSTRGQSSRGQSSRGQGSRGRGGRVSFSNTKRFRPPVMMTDFEDSFPDYEE